MKKDKQLKDIKRRRTCKIVCVLLFLLISVIGICVHFNIIKIPFVVDLLERTEQKQEFGDFSGQLIGESYIPKEENIVYDNDSKTSGYVNNMILIFAYSDVPRKQIVNIADSLGGSIVGEHEVIFAGTDEVIEFKHTAYSKSVFAKGSIEAAKFLAGKPAGYYDMRDVIAAKQ